MFKNNTQNLYITKSQKTELKSLLDFNSFKKIISLEEFKKRTYKDYYTKKEEKMLCKILNTSPGIIDYALRNRRILHKMLNYRYYTGFKEKEIPNKFIKKPIRHFKRKKRKKKLNLRAHFFFSINHESFLFYLINLNKKFIIKPFNFFTSFFFYKKKTYKKAYVIRKRKIKYFRYFYKKRRKMRRKRFAARRRKKRYVPYRFRKKLLFKRYKKLKIRRIANFLRFIAFLNICKKINLTKDDNFAIKSIFTLPHKLLKFNFNKINNSYCFFINLKKTKLKKKLIRVKDTDNFPYEITKMKIKSYTSIKSKLLKNSTKFKINKTLNSLSLSQLVKRNFKLNNNNLNINFSILEKLYYYTIFYFLSQIIYINNNKSGVFNNNLINENTKISNFNFKTIHNQFNISILPNYFKDNKLLKVNHNKIELNKLEINKSNYYLLLKTFKKFIFFEKILKKLTFKKKKTISLSFFKFIKREKIKKKKIIKEKIINKKYKKQQNIKMKKHKKMLNNIIDIRNKLKQKLEYLILNLYIFYFTNINFISKLEKYKKYKKLFKKIDFSLARRNKKENKVSIKKTIYSFLYLKNKILFYKPKRFTFTYKNKLNNYYGVTLKRYFRKLRRLKRFKKTKEKRIMKLLNQPFSSISFNLYKNYFNEKKTPILSTSFGAKYFKYIYIQYFKKLNKKNSKYNQKKKNINFLNVN